MFFNENAKISAQEFKNQEVMLAISFSLTSLNKILYIQPMQYFPTQLPPFSPYLRWPFFYFSYGLIGFIISLLFFLTQY